MLFGVIWGYLNRGADFELESLSFVLYKFMQLTDFEKEKKIFSFICRL